MKELKKKPLDPNSINVTYYPKNRMLRAERSRSFMKRKELIELFLSGKLAKVLESGTGKNVTENLVKLGVAELIAKSQINTEFLKLIAEKALQSK